MTRDQIKEMIKKNLIVIAQYERINIYLYKQLVEMDDAEGLTAEETLADLVHDVDFAPQGEGIITNDFTMPGGNTMYRNGETWYIRERKD